MAYLDLDELSCALDSVTLLSRRRFSPASFLRSDHLGPPSKPLSDSVRSLVLEKTGLEVCGPIRLLTQLRYFGIYFSPINLFYCFDEEGRQVEAIVAEVSNTPWLERHYYVLWDGNQQSSEGQLRYAHRKDFHVSPFMDMDAEYRWRLTRPAADLGLHLESLSEGRSLFNASMTMSRRPFDNRQLSKLLLRFPVTSARVTGAIYYQALKLWMKKCPFYPHPKQTALPSQPTTSKT